MEEQFVHIATIVFEHTYCSDGVLGSMEVTVQNETLKTLKNLGVLVKPFSGGFHLLTSDVEGLKNNPEALRFEIRCNDPYFINYTTLSQFRPSSDVLYFTNTVTHKIPAEPKLGLQNGFVSDDNVLRTQSNIVVLNNFKEGHTYSFTSGSSGGSLSPHIQQPDTSVNKFIFGDVQQGVVEVFEDGIFSERFYFNPNSLWQKPIGILEISPHALYEHYRSQQSTVVYAIQFEARKTFWEYHFNKEALASLENVAIINDHQERLFDLIGSSDINTIYRSKVARRLSESRQENFRLVHNFTDETVQDRTYGTIINHLPFPSPNQLYPNSDNPTDPNAFLFSHLYIHI